MSNPNGINRRTECALCGATNRPDACEQILCGWRELPPRKRSRIPDHEARGVDDGAPDMIRVCPHSDAKCPHGMGCPYSCAADDYNGTKVLCSPPDMSELIESVERIRAYAADIATTGHDRGVLGNAFAIRDEACWLITRLREGSPSPSKVDEVARIIRAHVRCDASGLAPAVASVFLVGIEEAARAVLSTLRAEQEPDKGGV